MSRNRYAVILLVVLALTLWLAGRYVNRTTATLCNELQTACTLAETGQMPQAQQAYRAAAENLTDLTLETDRACCQLQQIQQSFFGSF